MFLALLASGAIAPAQERDYAFTLGLVAGMEGVVSDVVPVGQKAKGGCFGGISAGVERRVAPRATLRGSGTLAVPCTKGDEVSICAPAPPGSPYDCLPEPGYAGRYGMLTIAALVQPVRALPLSVLAGGGWSGIARAGGPTPVPNGRAFVQWGASFSLGGSANAPRIEITDTRFSDPVVYIDRMIGIQFWLRL